MNQILHRIKKAIGPGVITGVADDDPSGIATYAQTGVVFGFGQLWLALYSTPFMIAVQEMCGRIGLITGKGITGIIKSHYSRPVLYTAVVLLLVANIINIGADLGAMSASLGLVAPIHLGIGIIGFTLFSVITTVFIPYVRYVKLLKWLSLSIVAYIITALIVTDSWANVLHALFVPTIAWNKEYLLNVTAMLGTTISPYLFFWQAGEEVEEELAHHKLRFFGRGVPKVTRRDMQQMRIDTIIGMVASNIVTMFIIITTAHSLQGNTSSIISASLVAESLRPLAGSFATALFALGIIGTGLLTVPVLAGGASYALSEALSLHEGLGKAFNQARGFYFIIIIATLAGAVLNLINLDPILMLYYAAAANGLLSAPLLVIILFIANNKKILGEHTNSLLSNILVFIITLAMGLISIFTVESFFR